jgi:uncharacterized protein
MSTEPHLLGRIAALGRYPLKSMRGEGLARARVDWHGLEGDRRYAFVRAAHRGHFPWLTARELPRLVQYQPALADPDEPARSAVQVTTPDGETLPVDHPQLAAELAALAGEPLHLLHLGRGTYDSSAISLFSTSSLASLSAAAGQPLAAARFRANLLVEATGLEPYPEDGWLGRLLQVGDGPDAPLLRVVRPIQRCVMINVDPDSAERDPAVLRAVAQCHGANAGVYALVERLGSVAVGDPLYLA